MGLGAQKAPEAARPLPLLYSSASDFQFRYAPVTVILGYKNQRDAIQRHFEKFDVDFYPENRHHHMTQTWKWLRQYTLQTTASLHERHSLLSLYHYPLESVPH